MSLHHARVFAICIAGLLAAAPAHAQSLADLAKKAQDQRDKAKTDADAAKSGAKEKDAKDKEKKVYTDQDLKGLTPIVGGTAAATGAEDATKPAAGEHSASDTPKDAAKGEAYWRGRWMPLEARIATGTESAAAKRKRVDELTLQLRQGGTASVSGRAEMIAERERVFNEALALDEQVAQDKASLAAVIEEGRHAGAPPGWFR